MSGWIGRLRRRLAPAPRIDDAQWNDLLARSALFEAIGTEEQGSLRELVEQFLAHKRFSSAAGHVLDDRQCLAIAALACLPVRSLGFEWLAGWREVIVYPGGFRARREHHDEETGVVSNVEEELIGEAWERGPVILSWDDVAADLASPFDGFNVVIHEIAHKLDQLDGAMNGVPRLPRTIAREEWIAAMQPAYDRLLGAVGRGRSTSIDPYAAESVEEYFAVTSELHFSNPRLLARAAPAVASLLARFYGTPPRLAIPARRG